jgi:glycosyltransferase involved in cell wall biosynthesis
VSSPGAVARPAAGAALREPLRVLLVNERDPAHPRAGGAEIHVASIFQRLALRGYEVTLLCSGFRGAPRRERVSDLAVWRLGPLPAYYSRVGFTIARETRAARYDVVVECLNKLPFLSPAYSRAPVLAICHHLFGEVAFEQVPWPVAVGVWLAERLIPPVYARVPFLAISESSQADLVRRGLPGASIRVSHCGIARPQLAADVCVPRARRIAYVGRLEPYKRVDVVLRAAQRLLARFPDLRIDIIGRGSARSRLEELAAQLRLRERTTFHGFVSDAERDALLAASRVCVFPSPKEGWGLVVIESNALGTPVVATDAPGLRDSVRDGETGYLVPDGDVGAFAARIDGLLADDALWQGMATRALEWSRGFDWDRAADDMEIALHDARAWRA